MTATQTATDTASETASLTASTTNPPGLQGQGQTESSTPSESVTPTPPHQRLRARRLNTRHLLGIEDTLPDDNSNRWLSVAPTPIPMSPPLAGRQGIGLVFLGLSCPNQDWDFKSDHSETDSLVTQYIKMLDRMQNQAGIKEPFVYSIHKPYKYNVDISGNCQSFDNWVNVVTQSINSVLADINCAGDATLSGASGLLQLANHVKSITNADHGTIAWIMKAPLYVRGGNDTAGFALPTYATSFQTLDSTPNQEDWLWLTTHEFSHLFGGMDESTAPLVSTTHTTCGVSPWQTFPVTNGNSVHCISDSDSGSGGNVTCPMTTWESNGALDEGKLCRFTKGQFGWGWWKNPLNFNPEPLLPVGRPALGIGNIPSTQHQQVLLAACTKGANRLRYAVMDQMSYGDSIDLGPIFELYTSDRHPYSCIEYASIGVSFAAGWANVVAPVRYTERTQQYDSLRVFYSRLDRPGSPWEYVPLTTVDHRSPSASYTANIQAYRDNLVISSLYGRNRGTYTISCLSSSGHAAVSKYSFPGNSHDNPWIAAPAMTQANSKMFYLLGLTEQGVQLWKTPSPQLSDGWDRVMIKGETRISSPATPGFTVGTDGMLRMVYITEEERMRSASTVLSTSHEGNATWVISDTELTANPCTGVSMEFGTGANDLVPTLLAAYAGTETPDPLLHLTQSKGYF